MRFARISRWLCADSGCPRWPTAANLSGVRCSEKTHRQEAVQAPEDGFEPSTNRLTAGCSAVELLGSATRKCTLGVCWCQCTRRESAAPGVSVLWACYLLWRPWLQRWPWRFASQSYAAAAADFDCSNTRPLLHRRRAVPRYTSAVISSRCGLPALPVSSGYWKRRLPAAWSPAAPPRRRSHHRRRHHLGTGPTRRSPRPDRAGKRPR